MYVHVTFPCTAPSLHCQNLDAGVTSFPGSLACCVLAKLPLFVLCADPGSFRHRVSAAELCHLRRHCARRHRRTHCAHRRPTGQQPRSRSRKGDGGEEGGGGGI